MVTTKEFICKAKKIHGNLYDYSKTIYVKSSQHVIITCNRHGDFLITPNNHINPRNKNGCKLCGYEKASNSRSQSLDSWIKKARNIHGDKYDYTKITKIRSHIPVIIICLKHGEFNCSPSNHVNNGSSCPMCARENKISSLGERKIEKYLIDNNINFIKEMEFSDLINPKTNWKLRYDFFLPDMNILIEFDGEQHFHPVRIKQYGNEKSIENFENLKQRDNIKTKYAIQHGYNLFRFKYTDDLDQELKLALTSSSI